MANQMAAILANNIEIMQNNFTRIVHDAANSATPGFKRTINLMTESRAKAISTGEPISFVAEAGFSKDMSNGDVIRTGSDLHIALRGNGVLGVNINGQQFYTRKGIMEIDSTGKLVDENGNMYVTQGGGAINIPINTEKLEINREGKVFADGKEIAKIGVFEIPTGANIETIDGGYFYSNLTALPSNSTTIIQGAYEGSNVKREALMIDMIQTQHEIQMAAQALKQLREVYNITTSSLLVPTTAA